MLDCTEENLDKAFTRIKEAALMSSRDIKCIVWDLDNTIWDGVLLEDREVSLKPAIASIIDTLDKRGILHSIASKNDSELALAKLAELGLEHYFLYPEIHWSSKSSSIRAIQKNLNIGFDTMLFIDDQSFELDEVDNEQLGVICMHADHYKDLLNDPRLMPRFITEDSARRREMYVADQLRKSEEMQYEGPSEQFLASLDMQFTVNLATENDLQRVEELTIRTNQLNSTGITYSYEQLVQLIHDPDYALLVCELTDKYGTYGKIGIALVKTTAPTWHIELLLMSCRVMSRGVGTLLITYIMNQAKLHNCKLQAHFIDTGRNRMMNISYRFSGFTVKHDDGNGRYLFEHSLETIPSYPNYVMLEAPDLLSIERLEEELYGLS